MTRDLVVLVPDKDIEFALRGLLQRPEALRIRTLQAIEFVPHPQRDPGVFSNGHELLAGFARTHSHALVVLDKAWDGAPDSVAEIESTLESKLRPLWADRARVVCINPEVEVWVWSDSPHVAKALGWDHTAELRNWLAERGVWQASVDKPTDPKEAFVAALKERRLPRSPSIFQQLGQSVSVERCQDGSFRRLVETLRAWFPATTRARARRK